MKNTLSKIWKNQTTQKAYRAAVVSLLGSLAIILSGFTSIDQVNLDQAFVAAFAVSALSAAIRAALAVIIPAIHQKRSDLGGE
jgi:hypothetical protein